MSDNELDNLFKEATDGFKVPKDPSAWKDMSGRLDQAGVGTTVLWNWKTILSITAVGIIASSTLIWLASQKDVDQTIAKNIPSSDQTEDGKLKPHQPSPEKITEVNSIPNLKKRSDLSSVTYEGQETPSEKKSNTPISSNASSQTTQSVNASSLSEGGQRTETKQPENKAAASVSVSKGAGTSETGQQNLVANENKSEETKVAGIIAVRTSLGAETRTQNVTDNEKQISGSTTDRAVSKSISENKSTKQETSESLVVTDSVVKPIEDLPVVEERTDSTSKKTEAKEEKIKSATALSLKLAVAPDFSSINYFTPDGSGFNFGALVGYSFNNRWSVYTGAILSRKIYSSTEIDEPYTTSGGYPYDVNELAGDCRVLDIPVNVYYTFFPEKSFSIKAGLGFTSYLMLREEYTYYIDNPYGSDVYYQKIEHENNEWFKMLNISMIVQKKLSNRFALELEPFLKAPLAGVGEGEVSLVSLGAFFNLRYDIPINKRRKNGE